VGVTILAGAALFMFRRPDPWSHPILFLILLGASILLAVFKIILPLPRGGATMTLSYAPDFACLMLLGANEAMVIAAAGVWCQCTVRTRSRLPRHRTLFSIASIAISIQLMGGTFGYLGGHARDLSLAIVGAPLVAAATVYFLANTWLIATAIALSTRTSSRQLWHNDFLWSAPSYFVAAGAAIPAVVAVRSELYWILLLALTPIYLTYRSYTIYLARLEDEQRHARELAAEKAALVVERERLAVTLSNIDEGVVTTDTRGEILLLNKAAEDFIGMTQGTATGRPLIEVLADGAITHCPSFARAVEHVLEHGMRVELVERPPLTEPHRGRTIECSGSPIRSGDGAIAGAVWVFRDITDTLRLEHERSKAVRLESLGILAGGLAHDFNNILTGIVGNISLARLDARHTDEMGRHLEQAERACLRARGITAQLLTFSKGGAPVKKTASIHGLVEEMTTFALRGSKVAPMFDIPQELWKVCVDAAQVSQVVSNLVINAQQAMPEGGTLRVEMRNVAVPIDEIREGVRIPSGRYVTIGIVDHGVGIAKEHLCRIFDPYFTTKQNGSGLGLATSYSILTAHGGYITVESNEGVGTRFVVYLPAAQAVDSPGQRQPTVPRTARGGRALIMDDEETIRDVARGMFERLGYETVTSRHGAEAIERFEQALHAGRPFDIVVMDLTVPGGMGGKEALPYLKALDPQVRAIVASGYAGDAVVANFEEWGFSGMIPKPFVIGEIQDALVRVREDETPASRD
jgi:PAS domain S-box-containing protein